MTLRAARREVSAKSDHVIERETAHKWADRALACFERAAKSTGDTSLNWFIRAEDYKHEALEHAALAEDDGKTLRKIERIFKRKTRRGRK